MKLFILIILKLEEIKFKYINLGNQLHYKKYNQKLHHVEYYDGNENTSFANISIPCVHKTCVFIFYHSIQNDKTSG